MLMFLKMSICFKNLVIAFIQRMLFSLFCGYETYLLTTCCPPFFLRIDFYYFISV